MNCLKLIIAFVFLFNPQVNLIDIFPDFIAWVLILSSLKKVRYLSIQSEYAISAITKMSVLSLLAFLTVFLLPQLDATMILTITFVINVLKLVWGIPAFKYLFAGLSELSGLYNGKGVYLPIHNSKREGVDIAEKLTLFFYISTSVLATIPEFIELTRDSSLIMSEGRRALYTFKPVFYVITVTIMLVTGIVWLTYITPFVRNISKDKVFLSAIEDAYNIKIVETGKHRGIELKNAFSLLSISGLFLIPVIFDGMDIFPRFLLPVFIFAFVLKIAKNGYKSVLLKVLSVSSIVISLICYVLRWIFVTEFSYDSIERSFAAYDLFMLITVFLIAEFLMFVILQIFLNREVYKISINDAVVEPAEVFKERILRKNNLALRNYKKKLTVTSILLVLAAFFSVMTFVSNILLPQSFMIAVVMAIIHFAYSYSTYSNIRENIDKKYL